MVTVAWWYIRNRCPDHPQTENYAPCTNSREGEGWMCQAPVRSSRNDWMYTLCHRPIYPRYRRTVAYGNTVENRNG